MSNLIGNLISIKSCKNFKDSTYDILEQNLNTGEKNKAPTNRWSKLEIDILKRCITIFGFDFLLIKRYFKNKTQKQIQSKFKKLKLINIKRIILDEDDMENEIIKLKEYLN